MPSYIIPGEKVQYFEPPRDDDGHDDGGLDVEEHQLRVDLKADESGRNGFYADERDRLGGRYAF